MALGQVRDGRDGEGELCGVFTTTLHCNGGKYAWIGDDRMELSAAGDTTATPLRPRNTADTADSVELLS